MVIVSGSGQSTRSLSSVFINPAMELPSKQTPCSKAVSYTHQMCIRDRVYAGGAALRHGPLPMPQGKNLLSCCGLGLWQTAAQYTFYYSAVALLLSLIHI